MKRALILILLFSLLLVALGGSGCGSSQSCTCKSEDGRFYGLCDNGFFSLPNTMSSIINTLTCGHSCARGNYQIYELTIDDVNFDDVVLCENSAGTGANGYIIVDVYGEIMHEGYWGDFDIEYIAFRISVYDEGLPAGDATVVRTRDDMRQKRNIIDDQIGIEIENYYSGNYTFVISDVSGYYTTYEYDT